MAEAKKHILIIEDEESMSQILKDRLELEGYTVSVASDGKEGLRLALEEKPDLIVLDIVLPKMNGAEVLESLLKDAWGKTARVVCLTNLMTAPESIQKAMKTHTNVDYIVKVNTRLDNIIEHVTSRLVE